MAIVWLKNIDRAEKWDLGMNGPSGTVRMLLSLYVLAEQRPSGWVQAGCEKTHTNNTIERATNKHMEGLKQEAEAKKVTGEPKSGAALTSQYLPFELVGGQ